RGFPDAIRRRRNRSRNRRSGRIQFRRCRARRARLDGPAGRHDAGVDRRTQLCRRADLEPRARGNSAAARCEGRHRRRRGVSAGGTAATIALIAATYGVLFAAEHAWPLRRPRARLAQRIAVNVVVSALAFATAALLVRPAALATLDLVQLKPFGLLNLAGLDGF